MRKSWFYFSCAYRYLGDVWPPEPAEVFYFPPDATRVSFSHWIVPGTIPEEEC